MLVSSSGKKLVRPKRLILLQDAENLVLSEIRLNAWLGFKYQIHWLRAKHWKRLANELSGELFVGYPVATQRAAADALLIRAGYSHATVVLPPKNNPIAESTVKFKAFTTSFLPKGRPCLMQRGKDDVFLPELSRRISGTYMEAAKFLLTTIREA